MWRYGRAFPRRISKDLGKGCRRNAAGPCFRVHAQGSCNLEAPSLGCCRKATGINWLVFILCNVVYDIIYDIKYDIIPHIVYDVAGAC